MTGFGRGEARNKGVRVTVELHAVNRKQVELTLNLPRELAPLDGELRQFMLPQLARGRTAATFAMERLTGAAASPLPMVSVERAQQGYKTLRNLQRTLKLSEEITLREVLSLPGVVLTPEEALPSEFLKPLCHKAARQALLDLAKMQRAEGRRLLNDLRLRLARLRKWLQQIVRRQPAAAERYRRQLSGKLRQLAGTAGLDQERLAKEAALYADRSDFTEELTRLQSHLEEFEKRLAKNEPTGRALDFLMQEMFREWNTLSAKANDARISHIVVDAKSESEKIREQIQNLE